MERTYLARFGSMGQVGRFSAPSDLDVERGCLVVIRSHRGTELGEILIESSGSSSEDGSYGEGRILREASNDDLVGGRVAEAQRDARFEACSRVFREGLWPLELVDVEPLLDGTRTVLHYLGPHHLDSEGLIAILRSTCNLDVMLQPVGPDLKEPDSDLDPDVGPITSCGDCGSNGGGCGTGGGCSGCGVKKLIAARH